MTSPIQIATRGLQELYESGFQDLDEDHGGVAWMQYAALATHASGGFALGHLDWRRRCLIGEYYLACVSGARTSLEAADLSVAHYRRLEFADNDWLRRQWDKARRHAASSPLEFLETVRRDGRPREREQELWLAAEHCVYHLGQAVDRAAVCVAVVGAFRSDLLKTGWGALAKLAADGSEQHDRSEPQSAAGKLAQDELVGLVRTEPARHGPKDWLPWLLRARHAAAHWAPKIPWTLVTSDEGGDWSGLARPFYRQPGWAETVAQMSSTGNATIFDILLQDEPASTLGGLTDSTAALIGLLSAELRALWNTRRAEPTLLIQPDQQWPRFANETLLNFPGYGLAPKIKQTGPDLDTEHETAVRLNAARLGVKWIGAWQQDGD